MQKRLVDELLMCWSKRGNTTKEIASLLGVTEKTIREDVKQLDDFVRQKKLGQVKLEKGEIIISCEYTETMRTLRRMRFTEYSMLKEERLEMESLLLMIEPQYITLQKIADFFSVSRSTVLGDLDALRESLTAQKLKFEAHPSKGHRIRGNEEDFRKLFVYIYEKEPLLVRMLFNQLKIEGGCKDKLCIWWEENKKLLYSTERETGIYLTDYSFELFFYYLLFMNIRIQEGHVLKNRANPGKYNDFCNAVFHRMDKTQYTTILNQTEKEFINLLTFKFYYVKNKREVNSESLKIQMLTRKIIGRVSEMLNLDLYKDYLLFESLAKHLERILFETEWKKQKQFNEFMELQEIVRKNPEVNHCVLKAIEKYQSYIPQTLGDIDIAFIVAYFCASIARRILRNTESNVLLVCNGGIGTGQLLRAQLQSQFNINILDVISSHDIGFQNYSQIDFVISTVPLNGCAIPYVVVSTVMTAKDFSSVRELINCYGQSHESRGRAKGPNNFRLSELLKEEYIMLDVEANGWEEAIRASSTPLLEYGNITEEYIDDMIRNIKVHGPYVVISKGFAIPHATTDHVNRTGMSLVRLKQPVYFGNTDLDPVNIICVLCSDDGENHLEAMFDLCNNMEEGTWRDQIMKSQTAEDVYKLCTSLYN